MQNIAQDPITAALRAIVREVVREVLAELQAPNAPRWLGLAAAAKHCDVKVRTISAARRRGEIIGRPAGHSFVFEVSTLDAWLSSRCQSPRPPQPMTDAEIIAASVRGAR